MKGRMIDRITILFALGLPLVVVALLGISNSRGFFEKLEWFSVDYRFQLLSKLHQTPAPQNLFLISIDDETSNQLGRWPFPRTYHAEVLTELAKYSPSVVAWDILFVDPDQIPEHDSILAESIKGYRSFVSGAVTAARKEEQPVGRTKPFKQVIGDRSSLKNRNQAQIPIPGLAKNGTFGFVDCEPMLDGVRRFLPMVVSWSGQIYPSLALQGILQYREIDPDLVTIHLGKEIVIPEGKKGPEIRIPINAEGKLFLNERRAIRDWKTIPYHELVQLLSDAADHPLEKNPKLESLRHSILLFGLTATGQGDSGATSLETLTPLVNLQLNGIANILQNDFVRQGGTRYGYFFFYLFFLVLTVVLIRLPFYLSISTGFLLVPAHFVFTLAVLHYQQEVIPAAATMIGVVLIIFSVISYRYGREERDKRFIKKSLGAYLSKKIMKEVLSHPEGVQLGGSKKEITVLFCDLRNFTNYCEKRAPEEVLRVLNEYLQFMTEVILKYDGTIDKYVGDAIMAFWGAPQNQSDHAQRAVCASIEMRYAMAQFRSKQAAAGEELFECGIGLHTGEAVVGNMGSMKHLNYTAIGSTVNLAARLEALTKNVGAKILISDETRKQISRDFIITELGEVEIKGYSTLTKIFSVESSHDLEAAQKIAEEMKKRGESGEIQLFETTFKPTPVTDEDE
jgi:adenylate cyclase